MPNRNELKKEEYIKNMSYLRTFLRKVESGVKYQNREYNYVQLKINKVRRVLPYMTHLNPQLHSRALNTVQAVEKKLKQRVSTPPPVIVNRATLTKKPSPDERTNSIIVFINNFVKQSNNIKNEESYKKYIILGNNVKTEVRRLKIPQSEKIKLSSKINKALRNTGPPPYYTPKQRANYWRNNVGNAPVNPMYVAPSSTPKSRTTPPKSRSPRSKNGCTGGMCRRVRSLIKRKFKPV